MQWLPFQLSLNLPRVVDRFTLFVGVGVGVVVGTERDTFQNSNVSRSLRNFSLFLVLELEISE